MHMHAGAALFAHGRFPAIVVAVGRLVVVAEEQPCVVREAEQLADRAVSLAGIAAGQLRPLAAVIRHEHRNAADGKTHDPVWNVAGGVAVVGPCRGLKSPSTSTP